MDCNRCDGKMVKFKYLIIDELTEYLNKEYIQNKHENYSEWLKSLNENDVVLTKFIREEFGKVKQKYYIRIVEKKTNKGIKLRKLSKVFAYTTGEIGYGEMDEKHGIKTIYKITQVDENTDKIIRDYCKDKDNFDIEYLNKVITNEILQR